MNKINVSEANRIKFRNIPCGVEVLGVKSELRVTAPEHEDNCFSKTLLEAGTQRLVLEVL